MASSSPNADQPTITSTSLIHRIQLRDEGAWGRFVDLYTPLVWGWCRSFGLQPNDADDVCQEVFAAVSRAITRYEKTGTFRGWLWQVTRNKVLDHFRSRQRNPQAAGGSDFGHWLGQIPEVPPDDASVSRSGDPLIARALDLIRNEFEPTSWTAFIRMALEHKSAHETAVELGWTTPDGLNAAQGAKRVRQAKFRVIKRLRDEFGELLELA
jgi:RNA polymerase sigma-70 factor (ECF subfamily)